MKIVAIGGKAENGKGSAGSYMKDKLESAGKKVLYIGEGDYLKFMCERYLGWDGEKNTAGRSFLQSKGRKVRDFIPEFFARLTADVIYCLEDEFDWAIIADIRLSTKKMRQSYRLTA